MFRSAKADKLFWGLDDKDNTMLKLATVKANLTEFPAGCAFEVSALLCPVDVLPCQLPKVVCAPNRRGRYGICRLVCVVNAAYVCAQSKLDNTEVVNRMLNIKPENAAKRAIMAMAKVRETWLPCLRLNAVPQACRV